MKTEQEKKEERYLISETAKLVGVESHVLRYWEEELKLPIRRNELGHRYYTKEDVEQFREIKKLKEQGLQLTAEQRWWCRASQGWQGNTATPQGPSASYL